MTKRNKLPPTIDQSRQSHAQAGWPVEQYTMLVWPCLPYIVEERASGSRLPQLRVSTSGLAIDPLAASNPLPTGAISHVVWHPVVFPVGP